MVLYGIFDAETVAKRWARQTVGNQSETKESEPKWQTKKTTMEHPTGLNNSEKMRRVSVFFLQQL